MQIHKFVNYAETKNLQTTQEFKFIFFAPYKFEFCEYLHLDLTEMRTKI